MTPDELFEAGARYSWPEGDECVVRVADVCALSCPSGRVAVCGLESAVAPGATLTDHEVLTVPPGDYPLRLAVAKFQPNRYYPEGFERVAAAALRVNAAPTTGWTLAAKSLAVDAGTGCIFDLANTAPLIELAQQADGDLEIVSDTLTNRYCLRPPDRDPALVAFFECGMGDGTYDLWVGLDERGKPSELLADLELLDHGQRL